MSNVTLNNTSLLVGLVMAMFGLIGIFGFKISPAVTQEQYKLDTTELQNRIEKIELSLDEIHCHSLTTRQMYLRLEREKYRNYVEIAVEEETYGALVTYQRAKLSLSNITNNLSDVNNQIAKQGC